MSGRGNFCELPKAFPRYTRGSGSRRFRQALRIFEAFCWIMGIAGIVWFVATTLNIFSFQHSQEQQLEKMDHPPQPENDAVLPLEPGEPFGKLSIPRIGLSAIVAEGVDEATLRKAVGHIPGTSIPEQAGNVALAGHRDTFFRDLGRVQVNDLILMETPQGQFQYRVEHTAVVGPADTEILRSSGQSELTLITCFPFRYVGPAPERFVVEARRVSPT